MAETPDSKPESAHDPELVRCAHKGTFGSVMFARASDGTFPSEDFWNKLSIKQQAKFATLFQKIAEDRNLMLQNREQFRQVEGDLYEFKRISLKMRIFAFRHENCWYLLLGMSGKKEDKLPRKIVTRAQEAMEDARDVLGAA